MAENFNKSGSKYLRKVPGMVNNTIDVYAVLDAFNVTCPALQHAIKKLLCAGIRGKASAYQDLNEAKDAVERGIQLYISKTGLAPQNEGRDVPRLENTAQTGNLGRE